MQSGFGRTGTHFWGFEAYDVVPDVIVMAKGIGNGYPLAAVAAKREIADTLALQERAAHGAAALPQPRRRGILCTSARSLFCAVVVGVVASPFPAPP